jgi:transposase-like protein
MEPIEAALTFLQSLKPGEPLNYSAVAKKYGCDRSTLLKQHRGVQTSKKEQYAKL